MTTSSLRAEMALIFVAFIWGATFVLVKEALDDVSALLFLAIRFALAGFVLAVAFRAKMSGAFSSQRGSLRAGLLAGICIFGGYAFQTVGLRLTTPSKSAFLTGMSIVMVPLLGALIYHRRPRIAESVGIGAATAGMGLLTLEGRDWSANPGDLLTLVAAVFFAFHVLVLGHYAPREGFERISVLQICTAAGLSLACCGWVERPYVVWSGTVLLALVITGLLATAAAFTIQAWAQQRTSPTRTALIFASEPVFAALTSYFYEGEVLGMRQMAGAAAILTGIILVELKPTGRR